VPRVDPILGPAAHLCVERAGAGAVAGVQLEMYDGMADSRYHVLAI
jgi:hypothetical protein